MAERDSFPKVLKNKTAVPAAFVGSQVGEASDWGSGVRTKSKGHSRGNTPKHGLKEATVPHCISLVNTKNELWSDEIKRTDSPLPFLPSGSQVCPG